MLAVTYFGVKLFETFSFEVAGQTCCTALDFLSLSYFWQLFDGLYIPVLHAQRIILFCVHFFIIINYWLYFGQNYVVIKELFIVNKKYSQIGFVHRKSLFLWKRVFTLTVYNTSLHWTYTVKFAVFGWHSLKYTKCLESDFTPKSKELKLSLAKITMYLTTCLNVLVCRNAFMLIYINWSNLIR